MKTRWKLDAFDITRLLILYANGVNKCEVGREVGCDHSTVFYHVRKHNIKQGTLIGDSLLSLALSEGDKRLHSYVPAERTRKEKPPKPKSYADYILEGKKREMMKTHSSNFPVGVLCIIRKKVSKSTDIIYDGKVRIEDAFDPNL